MDAVVTTQVTVSVTENSQENHTVSWMILWAGYLIATVGCGIQVYNQRKREIAHTNDVEQAGSNNREGGEISTGDTTRSMFYRLLCVALFSRTALLPLEASAKSFYWQLVAETFPEMTFASAWTLLVSFFVQLVGTAAGTATYTKPSIVIYLIAYGIYLILILTDNWNDHASVLLYAVLCCIYAALFGTLLYFGPRLVSMLQPSLVRRSGLAIRLIVCVAICMIAFAARSVNLARTVVAPPKEREWWWKYGCLELFPSMALLIMMYPNRSQRTKGNATELAGAAAVPGAVGTTSTDGGARRGAGYSKRGETAPLVKSAVSYGTPSD